LADDTMVDSAIVTRRVETADGGGGSTNIPTTVGTFDCRFEPSALWNFPLELLMADRAVSSGAWVVASPIDTDIATNDYLTIDSETYEVIGIQNGGSYTNELLALCFTR
ncbi:MAG: hypothetical protein ABIH46_03135, partial [Chloroflexota bacterium]